VSETIRSLLFREGHAYVRAGRVQDAVEAFEKALKETGSRPSTPEIALALADASTKGPRPEQSIQTLVTYAASYGEQRDELLRRATQMLQPQWATLLAPLLETEWRWLTADDSHPIELPQLMLAADIYSSAGDYNRVLAVLRRARSLGVDSNRAVVRRLYEIARSLNNANDLAQAADVLNEALQVAPDDVRSRWLLSEILRRRSYSDNTRELRDQGIAVGESFLRDALRVWDEAVTRADHIESWALGSRTLINEQLAKLPGADRWTLGWEAVALAQRALIARGFDDVYNCSTSARVYRALGLAACEVAMVTRAADLASTDEEKRSAAEERVITTANAGEFDTALELVRGLGQSAWTDAIQAFILVRQGMAQDALALAERAIAADYREPWCIDMRADCCREVGEHERFLKECEAIWAALDGKDPDAALSLARAGLWLGLHSGKFDEAVALVNGYQKNSNLPTDTGPGQLLGLIALARGDLKGGVDYLRQTIALMWSTRELDDLRRDLHYLAEHHTDAAMGQAIRDAKEIEEALTSRLTVLTAQPLSAERELTNLLQTRPEGDAGGWLWMGAQATLARLDVRADRIESAVTRYANLIERAASSFPEANQAIAECGNTLLTRADAAVREGASTEDRSASVRAYDFLAGQPHLKGDVRGDASTALMLLHGLSGDQQSARRAFHAAKDSYGADAHDVSARVADRLRFLIRSEGDFWQAWKTVVHILPLAYDRLDLQTNLFEWFSTTYSAQPTASDVERLPIVLELGSNLIPEDAAENWREWDLFDTYLPELKKWFAVEQGVTIKPVRVRANLNLSGDQFAILIEDVPVPIARNSVRPECAFVTAPWARLLAAGVSPSDADEERHPFTGQTAFWVKWAGWTKVQSAGLPLEEHMRFVIEQLRRTLHDHLHEFLDPDGVDALISDYQASTEDKAVINEVLPSPAARFHFSRVVRALVKQGVSVRDFGEILQAVRGVHLHPTTLNAAVRTLRLRLRSRLPGNGAGWHRLALPSHIEESVGRAIAQADGVSAARVLSEVRPLLATVSDEQEQIGVVLITARYDTAEYLRNCLRHQSSGVTALCHEEVYEPAAVSLQSASA